MKKCYFCLLVFGVLIFSACASKPQAKLLDLSTITEDIPIYTISVTVRKDIDTDGLGKAFFQKVYIEQFDNMIRLLASKGIRADSQNFKNEFNPDPVINFEEIRITSSFILHRYYWTSPNKSDTRLSLSMPLVVMDNGSMILEYNVRKDDPSYEPGYLFRDTLNVVFTE